MHSLNPKHHPLEQTQADSLGHNLQVLRRMPLTIVTQARKEPEECLEPSQIAPGKSVRCFAAEEVVTHHPQMGTARDTERYRSVNIF